MTIVSSPAVAIVPETAFTLSQLTAAAPQNPAQAPQSLVEYLAAMNQGMPASGASPNQLAQDMIGNLKGFLDRSQSMTGRARALADPTPPPHASMTVVHRGPAQEPLDPSAARVGPQPARGAVDGHQMDRVIQALGLVFDYSIETQLVVRGATQVSGAANTLLRGQ
jgi:hypothetical protein